MNNSGNKSKSKKIIDIVDLALSFVIMVVVVLNVTGIWSADVDYTLALFGISCFISASTTWEEHRRIAVASLVVGIFLGVAFCLNIIL